MIVLLMILTALGVGSHGQRESVSELARLESGSKRGADQDREQVDACRARTRIEPSGTSSTERAKERVPWLDSG